MAKLTRRAALAALGTGAGLLGLGFILRNLVAIPMGPAGQGLGGPGGMDSSKYMNLFMRHTELRRNVEDIPGGVRTTTESDSPDLVAELQAHVSSMYSHVDNGAEVMCMSQSLPTLFRRSSDYHRQLTFTESPWKCWRLLTLETRMESCRRNSRPGSRRRAGKARRRRPLRWGWGGPGGLMWGR